MRATSRYLAFGFRLIVEGFYLCQYEQNPIHQFAKQQPISLCPTDAQPGTVVCPGLSLSALVPYHRITSGLRGSYGLL
jgi:hypothetical protein